MAGEDNERTFSIGRIFSIAFGVMAHNPLVAFGVTLLLSALPGTLLTLGLAQMNFDMRDNNTFWGVIGSGLIGFMLSLVLRALVQGCLVRATIAESEGRKASLGECLGVAAARALPLIAVSILFVIGMGVGLLLLIVPGIMFAITCAVVAPVVVEERVGVIEAFGRASVLTRGARWKIFSLALLVLILVWLLQAFAGMIAATMFRGGSDPFSTAMILFNIVTGTIAATFWSTVQTAMYVELRNSKDGPQTAQLSDIFA